MAAVRRLALCLWLLGIALFCGLAVAAAGEGVAPPRFRCLRTFDALSSFSPKNMRRGNNCDFKYLRVKDANASVFCNATVTPEGATDPTCWVTVSVNATSILRSTEIDNLKYTLELLAGTGRDFQTSVHYKGFDDEGYSVCCMLAHGQECEWIETPPSTPGGKTVSNLVPRRCVINDGTPFESTFVGSVTKPLHRLITGPWEARIFWQEHQMGLGRVNVPFALTAEHLRKMALNHTNVGTRESAMIITSHEKEEDANTTTNAQ